MNRHASFRSGNHKGRGRRSILAVGFLNLRAHFLEALAVVHHLHHVTRDADADPSSQAHSIENQFRRRRILLEVARRVARVALGAATTVTGNVAKRISIGDGESVSFADLKRSAPDIRRKQIFRR